MQTLHKIPPRVQPQRWLRVGSFLVCFAAVTLLATAFGTRLYSGSLSSTLLTLVLIALCIAIGLHVRFLLLARREQRETATVLDATEREYKSVFDSTLDGILILDNEGVCLEANPAALTLFRTAYENLVGQPIEKFFTGVGDFKDAWNRFLDRKSEHRETQVLRGDGGTIFVEYTAKANYLPGRHVAVMRDVTRRKQAEEALRESEERFQEMAGNIEEIFWTLDVKDRRVLYVNRAYEAISGRSCGSLVEDPKFCQELIHPEDSVRVLSRLGEAVQTGQLMKNFASSGRTTRPAGYGFAAFLSEILQEFYGASLELPRTFQRENQLKRR